jgi:hypothetical protein
MRLACSTALFSPLAPLPFPSCSVCSPPLVFPASLLSLLCLLKKLKGSYRLVAAGLTKPSILLCWQFLCLCVRVLIVAAPATLGRSPREAAVEIVLCGALFLSYALAGGRVEIEDPARDHFYSSQPTSGETADRNRQIDSQTDRQPEPANRTAIRPAS